MWGLHQNTTKNNNYISLIILLELGEGNEFQDKPNGYRKEGLRVCGVAKVGFSSDLTPTRDIIIQGNEPRGN